MNSNDIPVPTDTDVAVIGAGIAGLCAAIAATDGGARVVVLDAHAAGGRAATLEREGFHLNLGPHGLYRGGHLTALLTGRGAALPGGTPDSATIGVLLDGKVHRVVMGPIGLIRNPVLRPRSRIRLASLFARLPNLDTAGLEGRSVADWLSDEPDDLRQFMEMFVRLSSYTDAPDQFDAGAAVTQLKVAMKGVLYVDGGWSRLIDALRRLATDAGATVVAHAEVDTVSCDPTAGGRVEVQFGSRRLVASAVVVAAGGPDVATRLTGSVVRARQALTPPVAASCLDLGLRQAHAGLVLGMDQPVYLSPHAPLADLAPAGHGLVSLLRYLAPGEAVGEATTARSALRELARVAGISDDDVLFERPLHRVVVTHGAPTAAGGGLPGRPPIHALGLPAVFLAGDWVGSTGLLADASSASGQQAGQAAARLCESIHA
jgi:phytoene dehydrogenase-like protein